MSTDLILPDGVTAAAYWQQYFAELQVATAELITKVDVQYRTTLTDCNNGIKEAMDKLLIATTDSEKQKQLATLKQYQSVLEGQKAIIHFTYQDYLLNAISIALKIAGKIAIGIALA